MHEHLDVPYHQQDTDVYCGAACAQMVLRAIGLAAAEQVDLYNDNHTHTVEAIAWESPPDGFCWTMNNRQAQKHFTLDSHRYRGSDQPHHLLDDPSLSMRAVCAGLRWQPLGRRARLYGERGAGRLVRYVVHHFQLRPEQPVATGSRATGSATAHRRRRLRKRWRPRYRRHQRRRTARGRLTI